MTKTPEPERRLVGTSWVAQRTGLGRTTVKRAAAAGRIPAYRVLGEWRFDPQEIKAWLEERHTGPKPSTQAEQLSPPASTNTRSPGPRRYDGPPLVVLYKDAPWRGIYDAPAENPAPTENGRGAKRRKTGT
jgi:excisionase family DNA binding protein